MRRRDVLWGAAAAVAVPRGALASGRRTLTSFFAELEALALAMEEDPVVQDEFAAFVTTHGLEATAGLRRDYTRVRLAFEATRDGGWWHLRWAITNQKPNAEQVFGQWRDNPALFDASGVVLPSATAECDELSALFAFVVRRLGVDRVGLFWPVWNHVVAVWSVVQDRTVRIVVPTSQVFLEPSATLATSGFDPWTQRTIFTYRRKDASMRSKLPAKLLDALVDQAWAHAFEDLETAQRRRNARSRVLGGS